MPTIQILHDGERFAEMLSYAVSRENLWGHVDVITRDASPGLLLVVRNQADLRNLVSTGEVYETYEDALAELGVLLDEINPRHTPLSVL